MYPDHEDNWEYYDDTITTNFSFDPIELTGQVITSDKLEIASSQLRNDVSDGMRVYINNLFKQNKAKDSVTQ